MKAMKVSQTNLRQRVLAAGYDGISTAETTETFAVSVSWVCRITQRFREAREGRPPPAGPPRPGPCAGRPAGSASAGTVTGASAGSA